MDSVKIEWTDRVSEYDERVSAAKEGMADAPDYIVLREMRNDDLIWTVYETIGRSEYSYDEWPDLADALIGRI